MGFLLSVLSFWMSVTVTPKKIVSILEKACQNEKNNTEYISPQSVRVSCVQWCTRGHEKLQAYLLGMLELCQKAVDEGAQVIVLPQNVGLLPGMSIALFDKLLFWALDGGMPRSLSEVKLRPGALELFSEAFQNYLYETYYFTYSTMARLLRVYLVAGSCLFYEQGKRSDRCLVFGPDGEILGAQDKLTVMGVDSTLGILPGEKLQCMELPFGKICVLLGEDAYYFEYVQWAKKQGVRLLCCPDMGNGLLRQLLSCRAADNHMVIAYSCFSGLKNPHARAGILEAGSDRAPQHAESAVVTKRLNLQAPADTLWDIEPNRRFLETDCAESYLLTEIK